MKSLLILILLLISLSESEATNKTNRFFLKAIKCTKNEENIKKVKCHLKPTRDGYGLTTVAFETAKPLNDIWIHLKVFYKFGTIYRPWMVDTDVELCCTIAETCDSMLIIRLLIKALKRCTQNFVHKCPYEGLNGMYDRNFDAIFTEMVPQVIPRGEYKFILRFHTKANESIFMVELKAELKAENVMETMIMG